MRGEKQKKEKRRARGKWLQSVITSHFNLHVEVESFGDKSMNKIKHFCTVFPSIFNKPIEVTQRNRIDIIEQFFATTQHNTTQHNTTQQH